MMMPNMDGPTCIDELVKMGNTVPMIISSEKKKNQDIQRLLDTTVSAFIHKPFSIDDIAATLSSIL